MKIEWDKNDFELDEDLTDKKEKSKSDTLDKYSEEMAKDAVGSLFDEEEDLNDEAPVVVGFDRPLPKSSPRGSAMQAVKSDYKYADEETPPRKRDRAKESNPVPKPAVRYAPPPPRARRTVRNAAVQDAVFDDEYEDDNVEEEMDSFRKRYKSAPSEPLNRSAEKSPKPRVERQTPPRTTHLHYDDIEETEEEEPISPLRWVFVAAAFVLLGITAFMAFKISELSGQLAEAQAAVANSPATGDVTQAQVAMEDLEEQLEAQDNVIKNLQAQLAGVQPAGEEGTPTFGPVDATQGTGVSVPEVTDDANPASAAGEQTYTAAAGDNLSKISQKFYGSSRPEFLDKIRTANNLANDNVSIGQVFIIPPQ